MFANIGDLTSNVISSEKNLPLVKNDEKIALVKDFLFLRVIVQSTCVSKTLRLLSELLNN